MSTVSSMPLNNRNPLLRTIALGGITIGAGHLIIQSWFVFSLILKNPFISVMQYMSSGAMGLSAFEGGIATALLGVFFHLFTAFVIAAVFILSADRIPLLRRNPIIGSLLYGFGVFIVMTFIVLPLSAAPILPAPAIPWFIENFIEHILVIGLPLGIIVQRSANIKK